MTSGQEERGINQEMTKFEITRVRSINLFLIHFFVVLPVGF